MTGVNSLKNDAEQTAAFGFTPSIRESILTHQNDVRRKISHVARTVGVALAVCGVFLAANFALTVTAVVSNKDVYVSESKGLVNSAGDTLSMTVAKDTTSVYDLPYQSAAAIAAVDHIRVRVGNDTVFFYPSNFLFHSVGENIFELQMKTLDGATLTWGPPTHFTAEGILQEPNVVQKTLSVIHSDGKKNEMTDSAGRRLQKGDTVTMTTSTRDGYVGPITGTCSETLGPDSHQASITGQTPPNSKAHPSPWPLFLWLSGTGMSNDYTVNGLTPVFGGEMNTRGFASVQIEYLNRFYPNDCATFEAKATAIAGCVAALCRSVGYLACSAGIGVSGWSQGAQEALLVPKFVTSYTVGAVISFDGSIMNFKGRQPWQRRCFALANLGYPKERILLLHGESDGAMGGNLDDESFDNGHYGHGHPQNIYDNCHIILGLDVNNSPCASTHHCIQKDGWGFYTVTDAECGCDCSDGGYHQCGHWWFIADWNGLQAGHVIPQMSVATNAYSSHKIFDWMARKARAAASAASHH